MKSAKKNKVPACISLDLDNQWSYMKIHGDEGWEKYPTYLDIFIPHVLDILDDLNLKITFFIVGKDAENEKNLPYLRMITDRGHAVGNHSMHHESWLQQYSYDMIEQEIEAAETAVAKATGQTPRGFRGPGFSWSTDLLRVLEKRGYLYDSSTLPTYIGPLARWYYFSKSRLSKEERKSRKELFGKFSEGFRSLKPYFMDIGEGRQILEMPVTTMPIVKIPFHLSYLLFLSGISMALMRLYLWKALLLCRWTRTPVNFLLHPLDIIGGDQISQLAFFPGMEIKTSRKVEVFTAVLKKIMQDFEIISMADMAKRYSGK
jgi:hypothetical protein